MAATWTVKIEVLDPDAKTATVTAVRHGVDVRTYTLTPVLMEPVADPKATAAGQSIVDALYALYEADEKKRADTDKLASGWAAELSAALTAKEK
jgi:hypothetical protein